MTGNNPNCHQRTFTPWDKLIWEFCKSQGASRSEEGNPQRELTWAAGSSRPLNPQLGTLHGNELGSLHGCDRCIAWSFCGTPNSVIKTCPWWFTWLLGTYFQCWNALHSLDEKGGAWTYFNLMWCALLTPTGSLSLSESRLRWRRSWCGRWGCGG